MKRKERVSVHVCVKQTHRQRQRQTDRQTDKRQRRWAGMTGAKGKRVNFPHPRHDYVQF